MYREFCRYVRKEKLFDGRRKVLLALSGGVDSVVLAHLMARYALESEGGMEVGVVHCNFQLRGGESERDERFVREMMAEMRKPGDWKLFVERFDTLRYAKEKRISVEMAARELRYGLFARLMDEEGYEACLLAHHADDNAETFFINLFRGSGVKGLRGMLPRSGKGHVYLRPLLFARRFRILDYARQNALDFVEDSTNGVEIYLRNRIRHSVLPLLGDVCEGFTSKLAQSMGTLRAVDSLLDEWYAEQESLCVERAVAGDSGPGSAGFSVFLKRQGSVQVKVRIQEFLAFDRLESIGRHKELFWELYLRQRAFSRKQIGQVLENAQEGESGRIFGNTDHTAFLLREPKGWRCLFLDEGHEKGARISADSGETTEIRIGTCPQKKEEGPACRQYLLQEVRKENIDPSPRKAYLDCGKLQFPLRWRHWRPGDRFRPLGTKGFKKLSDFFKDAKIGQLERDSAWLLCSGEDIVWIAGYRLDDRYKLVFPSVSGKDVSDPSTRAGQDIREGEDWGTDPGFCKAWVVELL